MLVVTTSRVTRCYFNVRSKADISQLNLPHGVLTDFLRRIVKPTLFSWRRRSDESIRCKKTSFAKISFTDAVETSRAVTFRRNQINRANGPHYKRNI